LEFIMANPYANLVKMLNAITLLSQPSGTTIKMLMERLAVSRRTVFRLLEALDKLGFPLINERPEFGGEKIYRLMDSFVQRLPNISLPGLSFTAREAVYLQALLERGHIFPDNEVEPALASLKLKLETIAKPAPTQASPIDSPRHCPGDAVTHDESPSLSAIRTAIQGQRACAIRYHSFEPPGSHLYVIHPLRLIEDSGGFFLFAGLPNHNAVRLIPVDRIASIEVLENTFTSTQYQAAEALLARAFDLDHRPPLNVVVRFSAKASSIVNKLRLSPDQSVAVDADGSTMLSFTATDPTDALRFLLSFGPDAEILAPANLRAQAQQQLGSALARYKHSTRQG
jgi:predicted DNA-binding transcriptional regulator YafY